MLKMADKTGQGVPVEYITGKAYFRYTELFVSPDVLIPRKETELVAGEAIELIKRQGCKTALDMCTGSGCIAVSIAAETGAKVIAADISEKAVAIADKNAKGNGASVHFLISDMFINIKDTYDIIVCNPPYVSDEEYEGLLPNKYFGASAAIIR
jgi:release factor glutamine methyltransferase